MRTIAPELTSEVASAHRKYLERNATDISELRKACEDRLRRAYGGDAKRIADAKAEARKWQKSIVDEVLAHPNPSSRVNCPRYIEDYAKGNTRVDNVKKTIGLVRMDGARPMEWIK